MTVYRFNKETGKVEVHKDEQPSYVGAFLPPPSWRNISGKHRRPSPKAHSNPTHGAGSGAGAFGTSPAAAALAAWKDSEPKPPSLPYAGIRTGEITGYRLWWILPNGLYSLGHRRLWHPGETVSGDLNELIWWSRFGKKEIWGGVYSFKSDELRRKSESDIVGTLAEILRQKQSPPFFVYKEFFQHSIGVAVGTVKCWGDVIEHETGYRAEFAKLDTIERLWAIHHEVKVVEAIAHQYAPIPPNTGRVR